MRFQVAAPPFLPPTDMTRYSCRAIDGFPLPPSPRSALSTFSRCIVVVLVVAKVGLLLTSQWAFTKAPRSR
jgi:hypothetical protein